MKYAYILMSIVFILGFQSPQQEFTVKQKDLVDLDGDGKKEVVELLYKKDEHDYEYEWKLVVNGKQVGLFDDKGGTYLAASMAFVDLLNNGNQEILLYLFSGGSVGTAGAGLNVFSLDKTETKQIFTDPNGGDNIHAEVSRKRFQMKYNGNYQVEFIDKLSGLITMIPLSKDRYKDLPDQEEIKKSLDNITSWVDPVLRYELHDVTSNKPKEIITVQRVNGIAHADTIALFKTKYIYDDTTQKYIPKEVALHSAETDQQLAMKKLQ